MRAVFLQRHGGGEVLEVGILPDPEPGVGEVRVRVHAAALNHLDLWVRDGLPSLKLSFPHVLGGDAAGIVDRMGAGVADWKIGDEVIVHPGLSCGQCPMCRDGRESLCSRYQILGEHRSGTHAEFVCVPAANLFAKPPALSFVEAASVPLVFTTAWNMLRRKAQVSLGNVVLVHAAGSGIGSAAIQIAKRFGAKVIATAGSDEKLQRAEELGAHYRINYATQDWSKALKKIAPKGCDIIIDHLGADQWEGNIRALRSGGSLVVCGATSGPIASTDLRHVFYRQLNILGSTMGTKADFPQIIEQLAGGYLAPVVDSVFALERAPEAFQRLADRKVFGKIVLNVS